MKHTTEIVKNFDWYIKEYFRKETSTPKIANCLHSLYTEYLQKNLTFKENQHIDGSEVFEFKIGLFRFICKDLGLSWIYVFDGYVNKLDTPHFKEVLNEVTNIIPEDFIKSLLK